LECIHNPRASAVVAFVSIDAIQGIQYFRSIKLNQKVRK